MKWVDEGYQKKTVSNDAVIKETTTDQMASLIPITSSSYALLQLKNSQVTHLIQHRGKIYRWAGPQPSMGCLHVR